MPAEHLHLKDIAEFDSEEEMLVALLSQDDPAAVAQRVVHARSLPIEKRLKVLKELEARLMRRVEDKPLDEAEEAAAQVKAVRGLVSSLYAQAQKDFADRPEGEEIGDPVAASSRD